MILLVFTIRWRDAVSGQPGAGSAVVGLQLAADPKDKEDPRKLKWKKWIRSNPAKGIKKFDEAKRERWLTVEELQKFREGLDKYKDESAANVLRLLLLTGSRASEALKARWEEFDSASRCLDEAEPPHEAEESRAYSAELPSIEAARGHGC